MVTYMYMYMKLIRLDYDNLENRDALVETEIATFIDSPYETARKKVLDYFDRLEPQKMYVGWDNQTYPQYILEEGIIK